MRIRNRNTVASLARFLVLKAEYQNSVSERLAAVTTENRARCLMFDQFKRLKTQVMMTVPAYIRLNDVVYEIGKEMEDVKPLAIVVDED